jgi:hypothetical protein
MMQIDLFETNYPVAQLDDLNPNPDEVVGYFECIEGELDKFVPDQVINKLDGVFHYTNPENTPRPRPGDNYLACFNYQGQGLVCTSTLVFDAAVFSTDNMSWPATLGLHSDPIDTF